MSTRQVYLQEFDSLPDWLEEYQEPVVRTQGNGHNDRMHRPDPSSDAPEPACPQANADNTFVVTERSHLKGFYVPCRNSECFGGDRE